MRHLTAEDAKRLAAAYHVESGAIEDISTDELVFDHTITDPPYDKRTQNNTRRGKQTRKGISEAMPLGFDPATAARRDRWAQIIARATRGWAAVFSDHESSMEWADALERHGMVYIRSGLWIRTGDDELTGEEPTLSGAPQFTGDRPAAGHEVIVFAYAGGRRPRWNGHGKRAIYTDPVVPSSQRIHSTEKPVELMRKIIRDFCSPGETVFDPFAGSGTTLVAARNLDVHAMGVELDRKFADYAARRAAAASRLYL